MVSLIQSPKGLDIPINRIQKFLYENLDWGDKEFYGRVYKNDSGTGFVPQNYIDGGDYKGDVFLNDENNNNANSFFLVEDKQKTKDGIIYEAKVKIVFMLDLESAIAQDNHRRDHTAQVQVLDLLNQKSQFKITELQTGLNIVLQGIDTTSIKKVDIHPNHIFGVCGLIKYNINKCSK